MKSVLVVFAAICIIGVLSSKTEDDANACIAESKLDRKLLDDMKINPNFKSTPELDCFAACMFKKGGAMDADGNVDASKLPNVDVAKECAALRGKDACETAGKVMECFIQKDVIVYNY